MKQTLIAAAAALLCATSVLAQDAEAPPPAPSPFDIVNAAPAEEWIAIPAEDLVVMTLAPDANGKERSVIIQLMPAPFSQGWVQNVRTLARSGWYDGISVNRVQDNYVVQWGDPGYDNPESGEVEQKPLPNGLNVVGQDNYISYFSEEEGKRMEAELRERMRRAFAPDPAPTPAKLGPHEVSERLLGDPYAPLHHWLGGFPIALDPNDQARGGGRPQGWPIHCYGMVGVGRGYSPDTGSGAELYTVIGHAPRHLDRNIALVGRIISGMEHLSSLPRGSGTLGFYTEEEAELRTPILSVRVASDLPEDMRPLFEYLSTAGETFAKYAEARANRRDPFFIVPAGGADICNIPVPIRPFEYADEE